MNEVRLRSYLQNRGIDEDIITKFTDFFRFPPGLLALDLTYSKFPSLVQAVENVSKFYKSIPYSEEWHEIARIIHEIGKKGGPIKRVGQHPLWGYFRDHGIYIALSVAPEGREEEEKYLELLAHVAIASCFVREKAAQRKEYKNVLNTAPAALRKLGNPPYISYLTGLNVQCRPVELRMRIKSSPLASALEPVCTILGYVTDRSAPAREARPKNEKTNGNSERKDIEKEKTKKKTEKTGTGKKKTAAKNEKIEISKNLSDLDDSNNRTPQIRLLTRKQIVANHEDKMLAEGEILHHSPDIWLCQDPATNKLETISQSVWRSKAQSRTVMQNKNQCLPNHWHGLSPIEVLDLFKSITQLAQKNQELEIAVIIALMIVTGQKIETILNFRLYPDRTNFCGMGLLYELSAWSWVSTPYQAKVKKPAPYMQVMPTSAYLVLDLPLPVQNLLQQTGISFFNLAAEYAEDKIKQLLSKTNKRQRTRLTIDRISNFLLNSITHVERADITTAMLITGREAYTGTVPAHYTQQQSHRLNIIYTKFWESVLGHIQPPSLQRYDINDIAGSVFAPKQESLTKLVAQLQEVLTGSMRRLKSRPQDLLLLIKYHNNYTRYVAMMVAYATGIRAITNPIPRFNNIDNDTGLFVLRDKDSEDGYHTRLMWCAPMCMEQLQLYWNHINRVVHKIGSGRPDFYSELTYDHNGKSEVFFIQSDEKPINVTPQVLHEFSDLPCYINLPDNAHRHYLRSTLLERNCPPEVINAYMGHWSIGEEPWSKYSSLSAYNYRKHLAKHIPFILDDLGFKVLNLEER